MYDESGFQQVLPFDEIDVPKIANLSSDDESSCVELRGTMSHAIHEIHKPPLMGVGLSHAKGVDTVHVSIDFLVADWTSMADMVNASSLGSTCNTFNSHNCSEEKGGLQSDTEDDPTLGQLDKTE